MIGLARWSWGDLQMIRSFSLGAALLTATALLTSCAAAPDSVTDQGGKPGSGAATLPAFKIEKVVYVEPQGTKPGCLKFHVTRNLATDVVLDRLALNYVAFTDPDPIPQPPQGILPGFYGDKLSCRNAVPQADCTAAKYVAVATLRRLCVDRDPRNPDGDMLCGATIGERVEVRTVIDWTVKGKPNASVAQIVRRVERPQSEAEKSCS